MVTNSLVYRLAVALAVGLMIGFERGWSTRLRDEGRRVAGFRTFGLMGLTGGVCAIVPGGAMIAAGLVVLGLALIAFHQLEYQRDQDVGATTFVAAMLTYGLGAVAVRGEPLTAAATATVVAGLLASKSPIHAWIKAVTWLELRAFLVLMAMTILVLPIMPRVAIDPWGVLVPAEVWLLAVLMATLSFVGHGAVRLFGERAGVMVSALAGGLVSSTAMGVLFARSARQDASRAQRMAGAAQLSSGVMALRTALLVGLAKVELLPLVAPSLAAMAAISFGSGMWMISTATKADGLKDPAPEDLRQAAPFDLFLTLRLAGLISLVMVAARLARQTFGPQGVWALSFLAGLGDVDAVTLSLARGPMDPHERGVTTLAIGLAISANMLMKSCLALIIGGRRHGAWVSMANIASLAAAAFVLFANLG